MFKLDVVNALGIAYNCYDFGVKRSKIKVTGPQSAKRRSGGRRELCIVSSVQPLVLHLQYVVVVDKLSDFYFCLHGVNRLAKALLLMRQCQLVSLTAPRWTTRRTAAAAASNYRSPSLVYSCSVIDCCHHIARSTGLTLPNHCISVRCYYKANHCSVHLGIGYFYYYKTFIIRAPSAKAIPHQSAAAQVALAADEATRIIYNMAVVTFKVQSTSTLAYLTYHLQTRKCVRNL